MGVHDEESFSWLKREKTFIIEAIQADKRILGRFLSSILLLLNRPIHWQSFGF